MNIQDYPNYLIYPDGRVQNEKTGRFLKPQIEREGFLRVTLSKKAKIKRFLIHRLIAIHYIPNPNNYPEIDHKDRDPQNNNMNNLRWSNRSECCQNRDIRKTNTSGIENITFIESQNLYRFKKNINNIQYLHYSKTLGGVLARKIITNVLRQ